MKRWHEEVNRMRRSQKLRIEHLGEDWGFMELGRYRKRCALACNIPHCYACHSDRYPQRQDTYQEWASKKKFDEEVNDL